MQSQITSALNSISKNEMDSIWKKGVTLGNQTSANLTHNRPVHRNSKGLTLWSIWEEKDLIALQYSANLNLYVISKIYMIG